MTKPLERFQARCSRDSYVERSGEQSTRGIYHHDRAEITYCPFFRRLAFRGYQYPNKGPEGRTRLLHSIEVSTIASGMARRLGADVDLTEAIALGHDVAQPPLGWPAESVLRAFLGDEGQYLFSHAALAEQLLLCYCLKPGGSKQFEALRARKCYRAVTFEGKRMIATLSEEVLDGIRKHTPRDYFGRPSLASSPPLTVEGQLVRIADTLSYISQEIDEAIKLDPKFINDLQSYAGENVLQLRHGDRVVDEMTKEELAKAPFTGARQAGAEFLTCIFGAALGPRVTAMIQRFEEYAVSQVSSGACRTTKTPYCTAEARIPVLEFDPVLRFLIDFLWQSFIYGKVNKDERIVRTTKQTRKKITELSSLLLAGAGSYHDDDYDRRKQEVRGLMPGLRAGSKPFQRRVVAHYISCLTDAGVDRVLGDLKGGAV